MRQRKKIYFPAAPAPDRAKNQGGGQSFATAARQSVRPNKIARRDWQIPPRQSHQAQLTRPGSARRAGLKYLFHWPLTYPTLTEQSQLTQDCLVKGAEKA